jgi:hypothetical protein
MRRYKVTLLVPHSRVIDAVDLQAAHKEALSIAHINNTDDRAPKAILHSVVEETNGVVLDFGPSPAAA